MPGPVVHVTTVHPRGDLRIFGKECRSLRAAGFDVIEVVGDGLGDATVDGIRIVDIGPAPAGRIARMRRQPARALAVIRALRPALVHLHDPELLPVGVRLAREGIVVVYDAHEDVPRQILTKHWIPAALRPWIARVFERYENFQVRRLSAVVGATPHIVERFSRVAPRFLAVANYPFADELVPPAGGTPRERAVCYLGTIMRSRGALEMLRALALLPGVTLHLAGTFEDETLEAAMRAEPGWAQVQFHGRVGREAVRALLARSSVGLVTLLPMPSYVDSLPVKLFEYMAAELPVVVSDFPLWRGIVQGADCGLCVDPTRPEAIAEAIARLLADPQAARRMGAAGRRAALAHYQWAPQAEALAALYRELLAPPVPSPSP